MKNIVKEYEIDIEKLTRTLIDFKGNDKQRLAKTSNFKTDFLEDNS